MEAKFGREAYANCDQFGSWEAVVDATAYVRGSRMGTHGKGKRAGLHLYVRSLADDRKVWLFVYFYPASQVYARAKDLVPSDRIRVETVHGQHGHAVVKAVDKLQ